MFSIKVFLGPKHRTVEVEAYVFYVVWSTKVLLINAFEGFKRQEWYVKKFFMTCLGSCGGATMMLPIMACLRMSFLDRLRGAGSSCMQRLFTIGCVMLLSQFCALASVVTDSVSFRVRFSVNSTAIQTELSDNATVLSSFISVYNDAMKDSLVSGIRLTVRGSASSEGVEGRNRILAHDRAQALSDFLVSIYSIPDSLISILPEKRLSDEEVLSVFPDSVPGIDIVAIRRMNKSVDIHQLRKNFSKLDGGEDGVNWRWYETHALVPARFAEVCISFVRHIPDVAVAPAVTPVIAQPVQQQTLQPDTAWQPAPQTPATDLAREHYKCILLKNNLVYDLGLVANLGVEFSLGRHYSLDFPVTFSPYNITTTIRCRTLIFQPSLRYWFEEDLTGLFVSLHGHFGYYDVALDGKTRWQNAWDDPMYGGGAGIGFARRFGKDKRWGIEAELGLGYAYLASEFYYNIPNGAWYDFATKHYWGPTRVNVGISYMLSRKVTKSTGNTLNK